MQEIEILIRAVSYSFWSILLHQLLHATDPNKTAHFPREPAT